MTTPYEDFVNIALGKALSADVTLPTADEIPVFTGIGRQVTGKTATGLGLALTADLDTDGTLAANSDTKYPSQKAVKTYADTKQAALADVITAGSYGSSTQYAIPTFNTKGLCTGVTLQTVNTTLTEANFSVAKTGQPTYTVTWVLTALDAARVWTVPNTNLDFGNIAKIPAVATSYTTAAMAGTRSQCLGGSGNTFSGGTDNIAIGCTNCVMDGTRNAAYGSTKIGLASTAVGNTFRNCIVTGNVELMNTQGVTYEGCTDSHLQATPLLYSAQWPNYSKVVAHPSSNGLSTVTCTTKLLSFSLDSTPVAMTTEGSGSNTEVVASRGFSVTTVHDVIAVFNDYNSTSRTIMRRQVVVSNTGAILSTVTPTPDIIIGITLYTLAFSVVSGKLRLTVNSNILSASSCAAEVTSRYF